MQYQYITNETIDIPVVVTVNNIQKLRTVVNCVSGVVGDTYGFQKIDKLTIDTDVTLTCVENEQAIIQKCIDFVNANYPPTT